MEGKNASNPHPFRISRLRGPFLCSAWERCYVSLLFVFLSISIFCAETFAHQRFQPKAFEGTLHLTDAPRIGGDATLILSIRSNLPDAAQAQIWFRLPRGVTSRSLDRFDQVYLPPRTAYQQYSTLIHVDESGNYPLQVTVYATLAGGKKVIQHFYTYLLVTPNRVETRSEPFDEEVRPLFLETQVQFRAFRRQQVGAVTIRGSIVYFDDNERLELPVIHPEVSLYQENPIGADIEISQTVADENGDYVFENLTHPALNDGEPRNLYVVVRFDNKVLSIEDRRRKIYELESEIVRDVPDGETTVDLSLDAAHPNRVLGHIFNTVQLVHAFLIDRLGWERNRPVQVIWPGRSHVSFYQANQFGNQVTSETVTIAQGEEAWRRITMFHEYGHAVMTGAYGYDYNAVPRGTYLGNHRLETVSDAGFAFNEGWAEFMEAAVDNRALNVTGQIDQEIPNIESNQWWTGHVDGEGSNTAGEKVEGAIASILWDIFDTADSIDDQPGGDDDDIPDRFDLLWEILVSERPQNITEVATAWRAHGFPMLEELEKIYATHHTLSRPNTAPSFQFTAPTSDGAVADKFFQITWDATDPDGDDITIDLFYDIDRNQGGDTRIRSQLSADLSQWTWSTSSISEGQYYLHAVAKDSRNATFEVYSDGAVIVDHTPLHPPQITSKTHPDPTQWYADNSPRLDVTSAPQIINGRQYSFILDGDPASVPDTIPDAIIRNNQIAFSGLGDGIWWVHIRLRDELGYWTDTSHFAIQIDRTPPPLVVNVRWVTDTAAIALEWDAVEDISDIAAYHIQIDMDSNFQSDLLIDQAVDGNVTRYTFDVAVDGMYYARIKAENGSNLLNRNWSEITPGIFISKPAGPDLNRDGIVDILDLVLVASHFGETITQPLDMNPDLNGDEVVDILDLVLVASHFGESVP
ncbi:hypothetical protein IH992_07390 [Candidatus Poribacteria bacterium]|nr:hypothetical protein [Candidatus Poribacteria bacterium]